MQYTGPAVFNATDTPTTREFRGIGSYAIWNTAIIIRASDNFDFRFNIDNVTGRGVPFPATAGAGTLNTYYQGLVGRAFLMGANVHF